VSRGHIGTGHSWPEATTAKDVPKNCSDSARSPGLARCDSEVFTHLTQALLQTPRRL
jgi:hypothetical protein